MGESSGFYALIEDRSTGKAFQLSEGFLQNFKLNGGLLR